MSQSSIRVSNIKGDAGGTYLAGAGTLNGAFDAIQALAASVIVVTSTNIVGLTTATSITLPAGAIIYGNYTVITWTSGTIIAYNKI